MYKDSLDLPLSYNESSILPPISLGESIRQKVARLRLLTAYTLYGMIVWEPTRHLDRALPDSRGVPPALHAFHRVGDATGSVYALYNTDPSKLVGRCESVHSLNIRQTVFQRHQSKTILSLVSTISNKDSKNINRRAYSLPYFDALALYANARHEWPFMHHWRARAG